MSKAMSIARRLSTFAVLVLIASPATATSLSDPRVFGSVLFTHPGIQTDTTSLGTISLSDTGWGAADLITTGMPFSAITAEAFSGKGDAQNVARAVGTLEFDFEIISTKPQAPVLITVAGNVEGSSATALFVGFVVESSWSLSGPGVFVGDTIAPGLLQGSFSDGFARTVAMTLPTNTIFKIAMRADAAAAFNSGLSASARAFIDPTFALGPGVDPLDYTFNFSPGIGNAAPAAPDPTTPVPEPATGVLLVSGLAALLRRRTR